MALETAQFLNSLNSAWPEGLDEASTADDHLRLLKACLQRSFTNVDGAVTATPTELNYTVGVTSAIQTQLNTLDTGKLDVSGKAVDSLHADTADLATVATTANSASYALSAGYASSGSVNYAASAGYATTAGTAGTTTGNAATATLAATATNATNYDGAVSAGQVATLAGTQVNAGTTGARGTLELATIAEALAGTDTTRAVTPDSLGSSLTKASPGYYTLPGGLMLQWGQTAAHAASNTNAVDISDNFVTAFSTVYQIVVGVEGTDALADYACHAQVNQSSINAASGFSVRMQKDQAAGTFLCNWIAIGSS